MDIHELAKELTCFGGLAGMQDVTMQTDMAFTFWVSRLYPNYRTACRCTLKRKESKRGAISYQFQLSFDHIYRGPTQIPWSVKHHTLGSLRDGIITAQSNLPA